MAILLFCKIFMAQIKKQGSHLFISLSWQGSNRKKNSSWKWPKGIEPMWYQTWERAQEGWTINSILLAYFIISFTILFITQPTAFVYVWYKNPPNWMSDPQDSVEKFLNQDLVLTQIPRFWAVLDKTFPCGNPSFIFCEMIGVEFSATFWSNSIGLFLITHLVRNTS